MITLKELASNVVVVTDGMAGLDREYHVERELYTFFIDALTNIANSIGPSNPDEEQAVEWLRGKLLKLAEQIPAPQRNEHGSDSSIHEGQRR